MKTADVLFNKVCKIMEIILISIFGLLVIDVLGQVFSSCGFQCITCLKLGEIMKRGGIANRLINFAKSIVASLPGGLAYVNVLASMLFGAISGSAIAATSAIGSIMTDRMEEEGYPREFSASVNITSSTTGFHRVIF